MWKPLNRRDFIGRLKKLGFDGPYHGTRHSFMIFGERRLAIPSNKEYSVPQLKFMLKEVEGMIGRSIDAAEWSSL